MVQGVVIWCNVVPDGARCCHLVQCGARWCQVVCAILRKFAHTHPQPDTPQSHSERGGLKVPEHFFVFLWKKPPLNCQHDQKVQWPEIHCHLLQLLLGADVGGVPARLLAAVGCTRMEASVALPGNFVFQF